MCTIVCVFVTSELSGWKLSPVVFYHWLTVRNTTGLSFQPDTLQSSCGVWNQAGRAVPSEPPRARCVCAAWGGCAPPVRRSSAASTWALRGPGPCPLRWPPCGRTWRSSSGALRWSSARRRVECAWPGRAFYPVAGSTWPSWWEPLAPCRRILRIRYTSYSFIHYQDRISSYWLASLSVFINNQWPRYSCIRLETKSSRILPLTYPKKYDVT